MTVTDLHAVTATPAGWYPDPVGASGLRWWSGESWTEHTSAPVAPEPQAVVAEPIAYEPASWDPQLPEADPVAPDLRRFSRDPVVTGQPSGVSVSAADLSRRKDPYRDRNVFSGIALVLSVLGLLAFVVGQLLDLPDLILYLTGGTPFTVATLAIVLAIRTGRGMPVAVIAAVLALVNVGMVAVLGATAAREDLGTALEGSTFEHVLEQSVVDATNTLVMPALAISADCPDIPTPAIGTVTDCTVMLENGDSYLVHVTSEDGLGGMSFELVDEPISGTSTNEG
ncbi:MAG: DUF2510 domain-containing protein [Pseudolysinimonas sp.]